VGGAVDGFLIRIKAYSRDGCFGGKVKSANAGCLLGFLLAFVNPYPEATPEMLARTKPNLFDLIVAVLAGFDGAYAFVDEKISPALPRVAIATAIVPPLANSGLCIAYGAYHGAFGSLLLFFANFLSILLVASILFFKAGMTRESDTIKKVVLPLQIFRLGLTGIIGCFSKGVISRRKYSCAKVDNFATPSYCIRIDPGRMCTLGA